MPVSIVHDVLVDLVGEDEKIAVAAESGDEFQVLPGEDLAGGIVGGIEDDRFRSGAGGPRHFVPVHLPGSPLPVLAQSDVPRLQPEDIGL